ncbi:hypothetical protein A5757_01490 [Mycobacterium sp. 852013-51886_SCH5428379]|nr:hypothetical protein A5757_01490 [Mycobacterium sp. 852013-51886_SCH5428379]
MQVTEDISQAGRIDERGVHGLHPMGDGRVRALVAEAGLGQATEPTLDDLRGELIAVFGTDFGVHSPTWLSRFTDATRQAAAYRRGRVLLAGDAAHVHWPAGGLGIGLGVQDAVNLGWKLGQVVRGVSGDDLLDTYHAERHPAGARALKYTLAQSLFQRAEPRRAALGDLLGGVLAVDAAATVITALITGLDVAYDLRGGHPLLGCRMPDLDIVGAASPMRMYELLHEAIPVLLRLGGPRLDAAAGWDRVRYVEASYDGAWELPVVGTVAAPTAVLVRPDGYVAWVGENSADGLAEALTTWFGDPAVRGKPARPASPATGFSDPGCAAASTIPAPAGRRPTHRPAVQTARRPSAAST